MMIIKTSSLPSIRSIWKVLFAITALLELQYIILLMQKDNNSTTSQEDQYCQSTLVYYEDNEFSINYTFIDRAWESTITISQLVFIWVGPVFCSLCIIEALVRAVEARKAALDNRALDEFEKSVLKMAQQSSVRLSMFFKGSAADTEHIKKKRTAVRTVSKVMRSWIPAVATIAFWLFILPIDVADFHHRCGSDRLHDSAVVTQWLKKMSISLAAFMIRFHDLLETIFWTKILPYRIHQPKRFVQRLQVILRWIRFLRFAAPLFRMGLKLQDQIRTFWKNWKSNKNSKLEKQRRVDRPSMVFTDIQNLLQLAKEQTALARVPSFSSSPRLSKISSSVMESYTKKREYGKKITEQLKQLQKDYFGADPEGRTDLYDRVVKLSQDITTTINTETRHYSHRYLKSLRALLTSRKHLISPRTRFSLAWRMTVTNCLLLEVARLVISWRLSETYSMPLSQIVGRLFVECKAPVEVSNHIAFITDQINSFRQWWFDVVPLGPPPIDIAVCIPNSSQAYWILQGGKMLEFFVDGVVFFDIFIWFLTGDIDVDTHAIIPKPFFTRCILPGTLVQVLDHPTLPDLLPTLLKSILTVFSTVGYSRCIRWTLAVIPALKMLVLDPAIKYFFEHIEEDEAEGFMQFAKSAGMLTPERKSHGLLNGSTESLKGSSSKRSFFRGDSDASINQVGMNFESPIVKRYELSSMLLSTEGSSTDGDIMEKMPSNLLPPSFMPSNAATTSPQLKVRTTSSPLKKEKSVHFGIFSESDRELNKSGVGYSLSSHDLHIDNSKAHDAVSKSLYGEGDEMDETAVDIGLGRTSEGLKRRARVSRVDDGGEY